MNERQNEASEATVEQPKPVGKGRDIIKLVQEDFMVSPLVQCTIGDPNAVTLCKAYLWSRSIAAYLKLSIMLDQKPGVFVSNTELRRAICDDLEARAKLGEVKYGERLRAFNGRDAKVDAYQESLDQCDYIRQELEQLEVKK